ncbi:MAG: SNF2 helicase associated domain-containing protein, partial [Oscillospiraceae bacterium]|nr:SNF2 helicase associated domain-containing protein [Oscillospiraceae bacterium]
MIQWQHLFSVANIKKGRALSSAGKVLDLQISESCYSASVSDAENVSVDIQIQNNRVHRMSCSCAASSEDEPCAHIAAVLFAVSRRQLPQLHSAALSQPAEEAKAVRPRIYPFQTPEDGEYHYYRMEQITSDLLIYNDSFEAARRILSDRRIFKLDVRFGYTYESSDLIGTVTASSDHSTRDKTILIQFSRSSIKSMRCGVPGCKAHYTGWVSRSGSQVEPCEHQLALLQWLDSYLKEKNIGDSSDINAVVMLNSFRESRLGRLSSSTEADVTASRSVILEPKLNLADRTLSFRIGIDGKMYLLRDLVRLLQCIRNRETMELGSKLTLNFRYDEVSESRSLQYLDLIRRYLMEFELDSLESLSFSRQPNSTIPLSGAVLDDFFTIALGTSVLTDRKTMLELREQDPEISLTIQDDTDSLGTFHGVLLTGSLPPLISGAKYRYFVGEDVFNRLSLETCTRLNPLFAVAQGSEFSLHIGRSRLPEFYYDFLPELRKSVHITEQDPDRLLSLIPPDAEIFFYLDAENGYPLCHPVALYGERSFDLDDRLGDFPTGAHLRNGIRESEALQLMLTYFPDRDELRKNTFFASQNEDALYTLLTEGVDRLREVGEVLATSQFDALKVRRRVRVQVGVSVESDLMDLTVSSSDLSQPELLELLESYRLKKKYHRLNSGEFVNLDDSVAELGAMMESLHLSPREFISGKIQLPLYRALYLDRMMEQSAKLYSTRDRLFKKLIKDFKTVEDSDYELPAGMENVLRAYQAYGHKWLRTLAASGFGGILADDMGLGKTLQMISVLLAELREGTPGTSLIVCPASLVYNWAEEFSRFAPEMKVQTITGTQPERAALIEKYARWDVLITSYDLLKRDAPLYADIPFLYEVIDEAQFIKTHTTAAAKAVKIIHAKHRFALTGTPIENRLSELWSIFDFLMPGYLYDYEDFRTELEVPITKRRDAEASLQLRRMIRPFVLRRLKTDVLKDLPEKTEESRIIRFEADQQRL